MASSGRKAIAVARADDLLNELRIREPSEIDIERIAIFKGANVRYAPLRGMDGCLVRKGEFAVITVRASLRFEGQRRFVIAHELGHFFLHPHTRQIETVDKQQANNWSEKQETEEYEANLFAAELLMPRTLFAPRGVGQEPSFQLIESLAREFSTTLTATAVQFVRTTQEECALVSAADRHRRHCEQSDSPGPATASYSSSRFRFWIKPQARACATGRSAFRGRPAGGW